MKARHTVKLLIIRKKICFGITDSFQIFGMVPFIFPKLFTAPLFLYLEHCECR